MTIYAEIKHPVDSRKLYETIGMNVTDLGNTVLVYGEPANPVYVVAILVEYGANLIQLRGWLCGQEEAQGQAQQRPSSAIPENPLVW